MSTTLNPGEEAQLEQTIEMFEVITQSQPSDYQSLEILKEAYSKLGREKEVVGTSKRIAQAYVHMGQLSSAILEYETILQRHPEDADAMAAMAQIDDPAEALLEGARAYRALALAHPMAYQVMFLRAVPGFEPSDPALTSCTRGFDYLVATVQRAIRAGVIAPGSPTETAQMIWASIHGWVSLELLGLGFVEDLDLWYDRLCEALLRGLRP